MSDFKMPNINRVTFAGRLTRDPRLRYIQGGKAVCNLGIAISKVYKTREGDKREDVTFVDVTVWDRLAEYCNENLSKGRPVYVEGSLRTEVIEDRGLKTQRNKLVVQGLSVQTLDWEDRGNGSNGSGRTQAQTAGRTSGSQQSFENEPDNDIPF